MQNQTTHVSDMEQGVLLPVPGLVVGKADGQIGKLLT